MNAFKTRNGVKGSDNDTKCVLDWSKHASLMCPEAKEVTYFFTLALYENSNQIMILKYYNEICAKFNW